MSRAKAFTRNRSLPCGCIVLGPCANDWLRCKKAKALVQAFLNAFEDAQGTPHDSPEWANCNAAWTEIRLHKNPSINSNQAEIQNMNVKGIQNGR